LEDGTSEESSSSDVSIYIDREFVDLGMDGEEDFPRTFDWRESTRSAISNVEYVLLATTCILEASLGFISCDELIALSGRDFGLVLG
jgi:hypothetical protein